MITFFQKGGLYGYRDTTIPLYVWGLLMLIIFNYMFAVAIKNKPEYKGPNIYSLIISNIIGIGWIAYSFLPSSVNGKVGWGILILFVFWIVSLYILKIFYLVRK